MCTNIRNDIETLNVCIKALRQSVEEGKQAYANYNLTYAHLKEFDDQIQEKLTELQTLTDNFLKKNQKLNTIEHTMQTLHDSIRNTQAKKEKVLKRFTLFRDHLSPQVILLENQLEECLVEKSSYDKFVETNLNAIELATYALCALINVYDAPKESWKKHFAQLKTNFSDFFSKF